MIASAGASDYRRALEILLTDPGVDLVIVVFVPPHMIVPDDVASAIAEVAAHHAKPVLDVFMAKEEFYEHFPRRHPESPPIFRFTESAARAASELYHYQRWQQRPVGQVRTFDVKREVAVRLVQQNLARGGGIMPQEDAFALVEAYGIPVASVVRVTNAVEAATAAERLGYPIVLKVADRRIVHKSDVEGVALGLETAEEVGRALEKMRDRIASQLGIEDVEAFVLQRQAAPGREVILGMTLDPLFGPLVMFGSGGRYVEVFQDIVFRVLPLTDIDAHDMVRAIKGFPLLRGFRGEGAVDIDMAEEAILRLSQLVGDFDCIEELDLNPFILAPKRQDCLVVDARIKLSSWPQCRIAVDPPPTPPMW
jgi:acetyltransferase